MILLDVGIFVFMYLLLRLSGKQRKSPEMMFLITWIVICVCYAINLLDLYDISLKTVLIILVGVVSFVVGSQISIRLTTHSNRKLINQSIHIGDYCYYLRFWVVVILSLIAIPVLTIDAIASILSFQSGVNFQDILLTVKQEEESRGLIRQLLTVYIAYPFSYAIIPIWATELFSQNISKKGKVYLSIVTALCVGLRTMHHGARLYIALVILYVVFAVMIKGKAIKIKHKTKRRIIVGVVICLVLFVIVSKSRGIGELGKSVYLYLYGCVPLLENKITLIDANRWQAYGFASAYGFYAPIMYILRGFGIVQGTWFATVTDYVNVESFTSIGSGIRFNAFVTTFYYPYLDFGFIGVCLIMIIYGMISRNAYNRLHERGNMGLVLYVSILMSIVTSGVRLQFSSYQFALSLLYILLLYKPTTLNEIKELNN